MAKFPVLVFVTDKLVIWAAEFAHFPVYWLWVGAVPAPVAPTTLRSPQNTFSIEEEFMPSRFRKQS